MWNMQKGKKGIPINYDPLNRPNRQEIKDTYVENGAINITKYSFFKKNHCRISGRIGIFPMSKEDSYEIDEKHDLFIVKKVMNQNKNN